MRGAFGGCGRLGLVLVAVGGFSAAALGQGAGSGARAGVSLCQGPEMVLFTCPIERKIVSVCGLGPGRAVYRFGVPGRVEIEIADLRYASTGFSGGGESQVQATGPGYRYVVYTEIHRTGFGADGRHDPQSSSGLFVERGGRTVSSRVCAREGAFDSRVEAMMPGGEYVPH